MKQSFNVIRNEVDKSVLLNPENPKFSLIWLHGLGDTPLGFQDFFSLPQSPLFSGARIKLLHAPIRAVTLNGGAKMPSWYDIKSLNFDTKNYVEQNKYSIPEIKESLAIIDRHVQDERSFWEKEQKKQDANQRIFVGGFSQGCATSLLYGLTSKNILGGIVGLSGHAFQSFELVNLEKIPIFLCHGKYDNVIPFEKAKKSYTNIVNKNKVIFKEKALDHEVSIEELIEINEWLVSHCTQFS